MADSNDQAEVDATHTFRTVTGATNPAAAAMDSGQAPAGVTTNNPPVSWGNLILRITETDVRKWISHLDSNILLKTWESL